VGETVAEQLELDLAVEHEAVPRLNRAIELCVEVGDSGAQLLAGHPRVGGGGRRLAGDAGSDHPPDRPRAPHLSQQLRSSAVRPASPAHRNDARLPSAAVGRPKRSQDGDKKTRGDEDVALAKLPTPTWRPSISTVMVPSGQRP
jgi:hypothetical protein